MKGFTAVLVALLLAACSVQTGSSAPPPFATTSAPATDSPIPTPSIAQLSPRPSQSLASATVLPTGSAVPDPLASPSVTGAFVVDPSGRKLVMTCWGDGDPTVFFESGGGALDEFRAAPVVGRVARETRICLYNRAGRTPSDPAPNEPREAEDVALDFHALVTAAGIAPPYVLFGRSLGGMLVTFYASQYPAEVAGVVVFDSPAPSATMTVEEFPEGVWDHPGNVEHVNGLTGYENRFGRNPVHFDAPLILISPTRGETTPEDRYWLQTSPQSTQVILPGGMEAIDFQAEQVAEQILSLVHGDFVTPSNSESRR